MRTKFLVACLALFSAFCTVPAVVEAQGIILATKNTIVTDAYKLGCTEFVIGNTSTYSSGTATANTTLINAWMDRVAATSRDAILLVPQGFIATNGTLGSNTTISISGYNGDQIIRALPNGMAIVCGTGLNYANTRYYASQVTNNDRNAGFIWVGASDQPMIRITGHGNQIHGNFYGYPYVSGADPPNVTRCRAAIEWVQPEGVWNAGHTEVNGAFAGFDAIFRMEPDGAHNHTDHIHFQRVIARDNLVGIRANNSQAVNHKIDFWEWYCPDEQSVIFQYFRGGRFQADLVTITGNYGTTVLEVGSASSNTAKNGCDFFIDYLGVDRSLTNSTEQVSPDLGFFKLFKQLDDTSYFVKIGGGFSHGGGADISIENWQNDATPAREPVVDTIEITSPGVQHSIDLSNLYGLDRITQKKYSPNAFYQTTAAGTAYNITASAANVDLGTTDPIVTLPTQGNYKLGGTVRLYYNGTTFPTNQVVTTSLYRTNNTAAEIPGTSNTVTTDPTTTRTGQFMDVKIPEVDYRSTIDNETITIRAALDGLPSVGNLQVTAGTQVTAERITH